MINLSFNHYENNYVKDYVHDLNSRFELFDHKTLSEHVLNECYDIVQIKVIIKLKVTRWLNFYMNESNNIRRERVINLLAHASSEHKIDERCFYINFEINNSKIINADIQLIYVFRQVTFVTNENLAKMNFIITNTCVIMKSL